MSKPLDPLNRWRGLLGAGALAAAAGCHSAPHTPACADIPYGAIPQPAGTYVCQWQTAQTARAELDDFVLYDYEWAPHGASLAPCGQAHVARLIERLPECPHPVVIPPSGDPQLDQARYATVVEQLALRGVPSPGERVVVAPPEAEGLYGFEAPRIIRGYAQSGTFQSGGGTGVGFGGGTNLGAGFGQGAAGGGINLGGFF
jgi:hypothetical protein